MSKYPLKIYLKKVSVFAAITIVSHLFVTNASADEEQDRAMAMECKEQASSYAPWENPQLDTFCKLATFDKCLADHGITDYEQERASACERMESSANALGVDSGLCSSSCN
jgi:hypothetical protein